jgi:glyoxylase-like metal-dependent hydrolase (beta-lactamase superfamily II)
MSRVDYEFVMKFIGSPAEFPKPAFFLQEGELTLGDKTFQVILTPGHSPGSVCLYWPEKKALFTGDVVFSQSIGRTDLPGGSGKQLKESISRLAELDVEVLCPGHGDVVAGRENVKKNFKLIKDFWFNQL